MLFIAAHLLWDLNATVEVFSRTISFGDDINFSLAHDYGYDEIWDSIKLGWQSDCSYRQLPTTKRPIYGALAIMFSLPLRTASEIPREGRIQNRASPGPGCGLHDGAVARSCCLRLLGTRAVLAAFASYRRSVCDEDKVPGLIGQEFF